MSAENRKRGLAMTIAAVGVVLAGSWPLVAQEPAKGKSENTAKATSTSTSVKKAQDPSHRVPAFFAQIGLSADQKEAIYKIRARHQVKLDALEKQVAAIRAESLVECESILNESQKKSLESRRSGAESKKEKGSAVAKPAEKGSD